MSMVPGVVEFLAVAVSTVPPFTFRVPMTSMSPVTVTCPVTSAVPLTVTLPWTAMVPSTFSLPYWLMAISSGTVMVAPLATAIVAPLVVVPPMDPETSTFPDRTVAIPELTS